MKILKQIISTILLLALFVGMVPTNVLATDTTTSVETGQTTIEGTNGFGALLSEDIQDQQKEDAESNTGGYNVTGLTIENGIATVEYSTLEKAVLVVALYSEDGIQLLLSGNTIVEPEGSETSIELEGDIPEYFMTSAYLLDTYDYSPLCASYDTPMYTKEMRELLASTTDDYDADKVLNLDDDKTTNFAIYSDTTKVLQYTEGVNTVVSADDETATYIIGNADHNITGLKSGDILAYAYGNDQILIVKVSSITMDGSTATIIGADLEMEEVFTHVKIENSSTTSDFTVDESDLDEGVTFEGFIDNGATYAARPGDTTIGTSKSLAITLDKKIKTGGEAVEVSATLKGSLKLELEAEFSYYVSSSRQFFEFKTDLSTSVSISLSGKLEVAVPLPSLSFSPIPGVGIGFTPEFKVEVSAKMEVSATWTATVGISYENGKGFQNLNTAPKAELDASVSGKIFIGLDLFPNANVLGGAIIEVGFSAPVGFELSAELTGTAHDITEPDPESIHTCEDCLEMELVFKVELTAELTILKLLSYEYKILTKEHKIGDLYYSFDKDEFAWGTCPYKSYRVTVYVKDANNQNVVDAEVVAGWAEKLTEIPLGKTNSNGVVVYYLQAGTYTFMTNVDGENLGKAITVDEACKVTLDKNSLGGAPSFISGIINPDSIIDNGIIASGECGASGTNVTWTLYGSGLFEVEGTGAMKSYRADLNTPWESYKGYIKEIHVAEGVTGIGNYAFRFCNNLKTVNLPNSLRSIGKTAFLSCTSLETIIIPPNVSSIGDYAFDGCSALTDVSLPEKITTIGVYTFQGCRKLQKITIPEGVTCIEYAAFANCINLSEITLPSTLIEIGGFEGCDRLVDFSIPNGVKRIGDAAFEGSENLKNIEIPNTITYIGQRAFNKCSGLVAVSIPESVTTIGSDAFSNCSSLASVIICSGVKRLGDYMFSYCGALESIEMPDSLTSIGSYAFLDCKEMKSIVIGQGVTSIGKYAFYNCDNLATVYFKGDVPSFGSNVFQSITTTCYYPRDNATWTTDVMQNYGGTTTWTPYSLGEVFNAMPSVLATEKSTNGMAHETDTNSIENNNSSESVSVFSIYDGDYETEVTDKYILKTASFSGLVSGEQYVLLALVSIEIDDILAQDNLLYIGQGVATEDGTITFSYAQREVTDTSYVIACGASHNNLSEAIIAFPYMVASEETQAVHPTVVFDGTTLVEGVDYVIVGSVDYTAAGEYTCYVRGIYNYSGLVQCNYNVVDAQPGDVNNDGVVDTLDRMVLSRYLANWDEYDENSINMEAADVNGDGVVDTLDRMVLSRHLANWDGYKTLPYIG